MQLNLFILPTLLPLSSATLIQIGFTYPLNWDFVLSHPQSSAQIYQLLPRGIAFEFDISPDEVPVQRLQSLDTKKELGYTTTLALFNLDARFVEQLRLDMRISSSRLYNNADSAVRDLMNFVNPEILLVA